MSCPFKQLYSNSQTTGSGNSTEDTITGWGCQVLKDGGLNFYIKTDKFLECEYHEDEDEESAAQVCPFRFHSLNNNKNNNKNSNNNSDNNSNNSNSNNSNNCPNSNNKKIDIDQIKKEIQQNQERREQKKKEFEEMKQKMNELDDEGHFTIPLINMPPFLTFKETKDILSSMEMKLKDNSTSWDQLQFYINDNNKLQLINENHQLNEIIKNDSNIIYLK